MNNEPLDHTPRWRWATYAGTLQRPAGPIGKERAMQHYYAIAEPAETGFRITFTGQPDIVSAPMAARDIVAQAQRALAVMLPADLPSSIEDGAKPPTDLGDYADPLVVVIPFERPRR